MKNYIVILFLFIVQLTFAQKNKIIDNLEENSKNIDIEGDLYLYIDNKYKIDKILFNENLEVKKDVSNIEGKEYLLIPILNNKLFDIELSGNIHTLKISTLNKKVFYIKFNYTPKYILEHNNNNQSESKTTEKNDKEESQNKTQIVGFNPGDNIYNDAKFLLKDIDKTSKSEDLQMVKQNLLKKYNIKYGSINDYVFLKFYGEYLGGAINATPYEHPTSNIAKTDVTNFATGMARFLADRAKQELNESFFIQMHKQMEKIPELQVYFPESYIFLKRIDANSMYFNLDHLRARFNQDIQKLPFNIYSSTQNEFIIKKYPQFGNLKTYLDTDKNGMLIDYALASVFETQGKVNPKDLLQNFAHGKARYNLEKKLLKNLIPLAKNDSIHNLYPKINSDIILDHNSLNILNTIKLAELISNSLLSQDPNRYWVSEEEIKELFTNKKLFQTYIGLVLAKSDFKEYQIHFNGNSFKNLIEETFVNKADKTIKTEKMYLLENLVKNMYQSYAQADDVIKEIKNVTVDQAIDESYKIFNVFKSNLEVINSQLSSITNGSGNTYQFNSDLVYNYISPSVDISYNLYAKKYSVAIKEFVMLLQHSSESLKNNPFLSAIRTTNLNNLNDATQSYYIELLKQESVKKHLIESRLFTSEQLMEICENDNFKKDDFIKLIKEKKLEKAFEAYFKNQSKDYDNFISKFTTYGTLIANVATAQNSDEVKSAIEASVLPAGSSSMKRKSNWALTLNAYVGGFYGNAYYKEDNKTKSVSTFGILAPIGITASKGNLNFLGKSNTLSLNVQLIDLGSLVNFYYKKGDGAQLPADTKIQLGDILAPGASLSYSLWDSPVSLFTGVQYVPNLSRIESISTNNDFRPLTWRWSVGLTIDIPLFVLKKW